MMLPILYKRSNSKEHINQWQIEVQGCMFRTITGFVGMKMFTGDWTVCSPKNVGKKNATTAEEQALFEAQSLWQKRKDLGYWEDINDCDKKVFFQPMLAQDYDKRKDKVQFPIISQPKLDGVRCIVKSDGMWTRNGKEIISAPHIFEELKHIFEEHPDLILDGELYTSNTEVDFNTIISCVRKTKPTQADLELSKQYIEYWVYDLPNLKDEKWNTFTRLHNLGNFISHYDINCIKFVDDFILNSFEEIESKLQEYLEQGFEGQILRDPNSFYENKRSNGLLKHKTFFDEEFTIIGYAEGIGKFSGKLATLKVDVNGVQVDCTINGTMEYLEELYQIKDTLIGKQATVKYFEKTVDGSLRFPKVIAIRDYE